VAAWHGWGVLYRAGAPRALGEATTPASVLGGRDQGKPTDTRPRSDRHV